MFLSQKEVVIRWGGGGGSLFVSYNFPNDPVFNAKFD